MKMRAAREIASVPLRPFRSTLLRIASFGALLLWSFDLLFLPELNILPFTLRLCYHAAIYFAIIYAAYRVIAYHPLYNAPYLAWLRTTPWRAPAPLPLGPVLPAPLDLFIIALIAAASIPADPIRAPLAILTAAAAAYAGTLLIALSATGLHRHVYAILFLVGGAFIADGNLPILTILAAAALAIAAHGAAQSLRRPPLDPDERGDIEPGFGVLFLQHMQPASVRQRTLLGWPYTALAPCDPRPRLSRERAILIPLVVGWHLFAHVQVETQEPIDPAISWLIVIVAAAARIVVYCAGRTWPISPLGRIARGRIIIPRFDIVLAGPLTAIIIPIALFAALEYLGAPRGILLAAPVTVALWIILLCPPSLNQWNLTGGHRLFPIATTRHRPQPSDRRQPA